MTAVVFPFPSPRNTPRLQSPPAEALVYWHCSGSLLKRNIRGVGEPVTREWLEGRALFWFARASGLWEDRQDAGQAARIYEQCSEALDGLEEYERITRGSARELAPTTSAATPKSAATNHGANL